VAASSAWFFTADNRNLMGLEGVQQFGYFMVASASALIATALFSSLLNRRMKLQNQDTDGRSLGPGFEALKYMTFFQAIKQSFRRRKSGADSRR
jgi:hypothetical protein